MGIPQWPNGYAFGFRWGMGKRLSCLCRSALRGVRNSLHQRATRGCGTEALARRSGQTGLDDQGSGRSRQPEEVVEVPDPKRYGSEVRWLLNYAIYNGGDYPIDRVVLVVADPGSEDCRPADQLVGLTKMLLAPSCQTRLMKGNSPCTSRRGPLADALRTTLKQSQNQLFLLNARRPHWVRRLIIRLFPGVRDALLP
jgi:hypothetical protein